MIASSDLTSSAFGAGTFAASCAGVNIGTSGGISTTLAGSDFCATRTPAKKTTPSTSTDPNGMRMINSPEGFSIDDHSSLNYKSTISSLGLLRNIQQHSHAYQRKEQRRSSIRHQRQGNAFGGHHAQHHADVDERLQNHHACDPDRQVSAEQIVSPPRGPHAAPQKNRKQ